MFLAIAEINYVLNLEKNKIFHNITVSYYLHSVSIRDFIYIYSRWRWKLRVYAQVCVHFNLSTFLLNFYYFYQF